MIEPIVDQAPSWPKWIASHYYFGVTVSIWVILLPNLWMLSMMLATTGNDRRDTWLCQAQVAPSWSLRSFYSDDIVQLATRTRRSPPHRYSPVLTLCMCTISFTLPHSEFSGWEVSCIDWNERCKKTVQPVSNCAISPKRNILVVTTPPVAG